MPAGDMDSEYSVGVNNRFIGIDSDMIEDPWEIIRAAQEKPKKEKDAKVKGGKKDTKPVKVVKDTNAKSETTVQSPTEGKRDSDRPRGRGRGRGRGGERGRGRGRGGFGSNAPNDESGDAQPRGPRGACHRCGEEGHFVRQCPQPKSPGPAQSDAPSGGFGAPSGGFGGGGFGGDNDDDRRGGRGGFRGRGGRGGGRGRGRGGGREFDRRSGSDKSSVKAFEKRDGSGSYNWGTPQDELAASEEQPAGFGAPKESEDAPVENTEETQEAGTGSEGEENKENVETVAEVTFEEWKKQQEESRSKPQFNLRKANEGEKNQKNLKEIKKPTEEESEADGSLFFPRRAYYYEERLKTSGRNKERLNVNFQVAGGDNRHMDTERGRRGGRGRSRGRGGGRGRDEQGGGFGTSQNIQLENADEFPSLA